MSVSRKTETIIKNEDTGVALYLEFVGDNTIVLKDRSSDLLTLELSRQPLQFTLDSTIYDLSNNSIKKGEMLSQAIYNTLSLRSTVPQLQNELTQCKIATKILAFAIDFYGSLLSSKGGRRRLRKTRRHRKSAKRTRRHRRN